MMPAYHTIKSSLSCCRRAEAAAADYPRLPGQVTTELAAADYPRLPGQVTTELAAADYPRLPGQVTTELAPDTTPLDVSSLSLVYPPSSCLVLFGTFGDQL
jgi:hypothetical protein